MNEDIKKIIDDYGQLHEDYCDLNDENGDGECTCAVKSMVGEIVTRITEFISHDLECKDEEQRKEAVRLYLENFGFSSPTEA